MSLINKQIRRFSCLRFSFLQKGNIPPVPEVTEIICMANSMMEACLPEKPLRLCLEKNNQSAKPVNTSRNFPKKSNCQNQRFCYDLIGYYSYMECGYASMKMVSFNAFRTIGIPGVHYIKPEHMYRELEIIRQADLVLFPETWQVPVLVYGLKKRIFPSIETMQLGFSKVEMTRALWTIAPEYVPYTEILANTPSNIESVLETFPFPFVAKEIRNSMGKGVYLIHNEGDFREYAEKVDVLYVQEYLENEGKDLRICVVGDQVFTSYWRVGLEGEFLHNLAQGGEICSDFIPQEAVDLVLKIAKDLNINHAGFDVMVSNGKFYILEFNVLFGNQGIQTLGLSVEQAIYQYIMKEFNPPFPTSPAPLNPHKVIS